VVCKGNAIGVVVVVEKRLGKSFGLCMCLEEGLKWRKSDPT